MTTGGIIPDYPPSDLIKGEAMEFIANYLQRQGTGRTGYEVSKSGGDTKPLPAPSVPGYIHLALSAMASHHALPYSGNVAAIVRDLVYIGLGAYAHVLSQYDDKDEETQRVAHIIRQEETFRTDRLMELMSMSRVTELASASLMLQMAADGGDLTEIFDQLQRLFYEIGQVPSNMLKRLLLRQMYSTPEVRDGLGMLDADAVYHHDTEVEIWVQRFDELAEQLDQEAT